MRVVCIGGATQDIFLTCQTTDHITLQQKNFTSRYLIFNPQDKVEAQNIMYTTGGGATNTATSFVTMGFETFCLCSIGNDFTGNSVIEELEKTGINTSLIQKTDKERTGTSVIINDKQGDRVLLAYRGANNMLELPNNFQEVTGQADIVYITSLSNQSAQHLPLITQQAKKSNTTVAVNPGKSQFTQTGLEPLKNSLKNIDILILNFNEAKQLTVSLLENDASYQHVLSKKPRHQICATNISEEHPYLIDNAIPHENLFFSIRSFFNATLKLGPSIIIVTNGCNGVYVATQKNIYFHPSMKIPVKDTVGAGDSFGSAFVGNWNKTKQIEIALRNGIANSASVLQHIGAKAGLLSLEKQNDLTQKLETSLLKFFPL